MKVSRPFFNDPHFESHAYVSIVPHEKHRVTNVEVIFYNDSQNRHYAFHKVDETIFTWWITIPFYTEKPDEAFAEIKKDEYVNQGYSEC
jgi:hypothetical protein